MRVGPVSNAERVVRSNQRGRAGLGAPIGVRRQAEIQAAKGWFRCSGPREPDILVFLHHCVVVIVEDGGRKVKHGATQGPVGYAKARLPAVELFVKVATRAGSVGELWLHGPGDTDRPIRHVQPRFDAVIIGRGDIIPANAGGDHQIAGRLPRILGVPPEPIDELIRSGGAHPGAIVIECAEHEAGRTEAGAVGSSILSGADSRESRPNAPAVVEGADVVVHAARANRVIADHLGQGPGDSPWSVPGPAEWQNRTRLSSRCSGSHSEAVPSRRVWDPAQRIPWRPLSRDPSAHNSHSCCRTCIRNGSSKWFSH